MSAAVFTTVLWGLLSFPWIIAAMHSTPLYLETAFTDSPGATGSGASSPRW